jgi:hypothetical protein
LIFLAAPTGYGRRFKTGQMIGLCGAVDEKGVKTEPLVRESSS